MDEGDGPNGTAEESDCIVSAFLPFVRIVEFGADVGTTDVVSREDTKFVKRIRAL